MIYISLSKSAIRQRIEAIIDFAYDEETGEAFAQKLNNAWYELFGMQEVLAATQAYLFQDQRSQQELDEIQVLLRQAIAVIETVFETATDAKDRTIRASRDPTQE